MTEKLQQLLDDNEAVVASKVQKAFEGFWTKYESYMKKKAFDEALKLCESDELRNTNPFPLLRSDADLLKSFFVSVEKTLPSLKGKTIRIGGIAMSVKGVKDGKLQLSGGGAEMAWDADRLDGDTLLKLGLAGIEDAKSQVRARAIHAFYFSKPDDAVGVLKEAADAGEDVSFYQSRMVPTLAVTASPGCNSRAEEKGGC
jgi:hypothetical protein